jgi:hypothetical protein
VKGYAEKYARQCVRSVGGEPIVYEVYAVNPKHMVTAEGCDIYFDNEAIIGIIFPVKFGGRERKRNNKILRKEIKQCLMQMPHTFR